MDDLPVPTLSYLPARTGAAMDLGFLIYFGPSFVHHILGAGIDATFISIWINPTRPDSSGTRTNQELNLNIRYRVILVSYQYNFGKMPYNNIDTTRPKQVIETNTFRILIGFKF